MSHEFLSEPWFEALEGLRAEMPEPPPQMAGVAINVVVTEGPSGETEIHMNGGRFERGLIDDAPTKLLVPYDVAKSLFIKADPQAAMQAFMSGRIKVEGDMTKLMAMQSAGGPTPEQAAFQAKLQAITA
jgi:hypothetical protein